MRAWLASRGHDAAKIARALDPLHRESDNTARSPVENNRAVYDLLHYGIPVKIEAGKVTESVFAMNWEHPEENDFAIAEEVTLRGGFERRPDLVLYVNGIAVAVIECWRRSKSDPGWGLVPKFS